MCSSSGASCKSCNRNPARVNEGLSRVAPIFLRDRGVSDGAYVESILWLLGASGGEMPNAGVSILWRPMPGDCRSTGGWPTSGPRNSIGPGESVS